MCSSDTHDRFVTEHAEVQREKSVWHYLPRNTFTVISIDNFDMLQSHAAVYSGDQYCSYHGTTIQLTQPTPNMCISGPSNVSDRLKRNLEWSPSNSPHKLGKTGPKRLRSLKPRNLLEQLQIPVLY